MNEGGASLGIHHPTCAHHQRQPCSHHTTTLKTVHNKGDGAVLIVVGGLIKMGGNAAMQCDAILTLGCWWWEAASVTVIGNVGELRLFSSRYKTASHFSFIYCHYDHVLKSAGHGRVRWFLSI